MANITRYGKIGAYLNYLRNVNLYVFENCPHPHGQSPAGPARPGNSKGKIL